MSSSRKNQFRVLVGGIWHETNTFSPIQTDIPDFERYLYLRGMEIFEKLTGTNTEIGGMIFQAPAESIDLIPSAWAGAVPSGLVRRAALEQIVDDICSAASDTEEFDGVLLSLHGAMVVEGIEEGDAYVLERIRAEVGPEMPIVCTIDMHANVSDALVDLADVLIGYETLPHVDMAERGAEAVTVLKEILAGGKKPEKAFRKLPLLTVPQMQGTADEPMLEIMSLKNSITQKDGVRTCSVVVGFPYCDVPHLGASILAYGERAECEAAVDQLSELMWSRRHNFLPSLVSPDEVLKVALRENVNPIFLVEPADNVGGGAPGDGTVLLAALKRHRSEGAVFTVWDPVAASAAVAVGCGGKFSGFVGGNTIAMQGEPVRISGTVTFADRVRYRRDSDWMRGQAVDLGLVATVQDAGITIVITSERVMPFDTLHLRIPGVDIENSKLIVVKSGINWIGTFKDISKKHYNVDTPGVCSSNLERLEYNFENTQSYFPLNKDSKFVNEI